MLRQRKLNEDAIDRVVAVEPVDFGEQFRLGERFGKDVLMTTQSELFRFPGLVPDVDLGSRVISDPKDDERRPEPQPGNGRYDLFFDLLCDYFAVDEVCGHGRRLYHGCSAASRCWVGVPPARANEGC